jgi:hypothetical protein
MGSGPAPSTPRTAPGAAALPFGATSLPVEVARRRRALPTIEARPEGFLAEGCLSGRGFLMYLRRTAGMILLAMGSLALLATGAGAADLESRTLEQEFFDWDGTAEQILGWQNNVMLGEFAQLFEAQSGDGVLTRVVVCLYGPGPGAEVKGAAAIYADNGPGGRPGTLLAKSAETSIPGPSAAYDCSDITVPATVVTGPFYAAFQWRHDLYPGFGVALDTSAGTPFSEIWGRSQVGGALSAWSRVNDAVPAARSLGIGVRGILDEDLLEDCHNTSTVLCLNQGRFRVEVDWRTREDVEGAGRVVQYRSDDSGLFYFFNADNWELLVKVLNACVPPFNRYWVFYAATTDVEFTMLVTDTHTGKVKTYFNPQRMPAAPVQDTDAFATCP